MECRQCRCFLLLLGLVHGLDSDGRAGLQDLTVLRGLASQRLRRRRTRPRRTCGTWPCAADELRHHRHPGVVASRIQRLRGEHPQDSPWPRGCRGARPRHRQPRRQPRLFALASAVAHERVEHDLGPHELLAAIRLRFERRDGDAYVGGHARSLRRECVRGPLAQRHAGQHLAALDAAVRLGQPHAAEPRQHEPLGEGQQRSRGGAHHRGKRSSARVVGEH
mmetsp:Transcript_41593/g.114639  ORF Transcript_41593/g.114639 Transcript_41593/m.114639 type:complete len:221 (-) Transcript_41593:543-1205(-)